MAVSSQRLGIRAKGNLQGQKHLIMRLKGPSMILFYFVLLFCGIIAAFSENSSATTEDLDFGSDIFGRTERSFSGSLVEPPARPNAYWDDPHFRPYFDNTTDRNVTYQLSKTAYLHCRIRQLGDRVVSWVRQRDLHILTVGKYTYTTDQRYTSIHMDESDDWTLEIKYLQKKDAGIYECQISTEPKLSLAIQLNVVVAKATIPEGPVLYVQSGSNINLTCIVTENATPPVYVFWYHDDRMINYDSQRGGIKVTTDKGPTTISRLQIFSAQSSDSGNYSCQPSYADPANITVHVLNGRRLWSATEWTQGDANTDRMKGEKPAAMQHGRSNVAYFRPVSPALSVILSVFSSFYLLQIFMG